MPAEVNSGRKNVKKLGTDHVNLDQKVYGQLKAMILDQTLKSGSKIFQEKLAEDLGISRTPLVNALKKLEQEHLITAIPRKGFYVREFSKEEMVYIFELREVLEGLAARRAALRVSAGQIQKLQSLFEGLTRAEASGSVEKYAKEAFTFF
jgi:DNA-binding GntR family transcriptional regulator